MLPVVPMFHANAWGLAYSSGITGADLLLPGPFTQPAALLGLLQEERATIAAAVPTVWLDLLAHLDEHAGDLSSLRTVICGGAAVPLLAHAGLRGAPRGADPPGVGDDRDGAARLGGAAAARDRRGRATPRGASATPRGRLLPFVEARVVAEDGTVLPWDGESDGELEVRGPWVAAGYFAVDAPEKFDDGWLRTGDIASIDERGYIRITDRSKDVIKSGGEWISSVELEKELIAHPDVVEAAVIAKPDERWTERPLACVVLRPDATCDAEALRAHLADTVARWWLPDEFAFIDEVPKTGTGKYDKKVLRQRLADGALEGRVSVGAAEATRERLSRFAAARPVASVAAAPATVRSVLPTRSGSGIAW